MAKKMLINATQAEESRVAIVENGVLEWIEIETGGHEKLKGNIYKGVIESVNSSLQAAFVKFSAGRAGFLPLDEVNFRTLPKRKGARGKAEKDKKEKVVRNRGARARISDHLRSGQEVLVQVVREQYASKPPTLSTFISLPGRYLVLLPDSDSGGVSRRIEDESGRDRLKKVLKQLEPPEGMGLIVRTAGMDQTKTVLTKDVRYLTRLWQQIRRACEKVSAPALIFQERDLVLRAIRDLFRPDIDEVVIDDEEMYKRAARYFKSIVPTKQKLLKHYDGEDPLFTRYNLEDQLENIYKRRVNLKSGGAIVIDDTEALTSIDVNSGKTRESNIEETATKTNLEAAEEIARQLRLRDIGGLVVIDFIDMRNRSNIRAVEKKLKEAMKPDPARYDVTRISKLGLMEMSRQRMRARTTAAAYRTCDECEGLGVVMTVESAALALLRRIHTRAARGDFSRIRMLLPADIANFLLNRKRGHILRLEQRYDTEIHIVGRPDMNPADVQVETERRVAVDHASEPKVKHPEQDPRDDIDDDDVDEVEDKPVESKPKRRRGTRGGRGRRKKVDTEERAAAPAADEPAGVEPAAAAESPENESASEPKETRPRRRRGSRGGRRRRSSRAAAADTEPDARGDDGPAQDAEVSGPPDVVSGSDEEWSAEHALPPPTDPS